ncbi:MAG: substrate-binding domain-containing protein [Treponema sp.]
MKLVKFLGFILVSAVCVTAASAMGAKDAGGIRNDITVISRESGSGTRGAFIELFGVEVKNAAGKKVDMTADTADITNSTEVVLTSVAENSSAVGYISLGSLNSTVKALKIDGAAATVANIRNGSYRISRPFNIVTRSDLSNAAKEFYRYILSADGQAVIEKNGYIAAVKNPAYMVNVKTGKVTVAGSSSVFPVMEKLAEAFKAADPGVTVEVSQSDSTTGINSATQGVCDIGMASRALTDSEISKGVTGTKIALDGIAIIVNKLNPAGNLSKEQVRKVFTGEITKWPELKQ